MNRSKILYSFLLAITFISCTKGKLLKVPQISTDFIQENTVELESDFFLIGPSIDSVNTELRVGCDCCASDLIFANDSSFLYIELCLGGDVYIKGDYLVFGDLLILHTDKEIVSSDSPIDTPGVDLPTTYELIQQEPIYLTYRISNLKGTQVITYSKGKYREYGMPVYSGSTNHFFRELRKEKVLRNYLDSE
nr:hypothetical protein [uncultured Fluviicola sp.]